MIELGRCHAVNAWEPRRLSDYFEFLKTNTLPRSYLEVSESGIVDIHYGDILINYDSCLPIGHNALPCLKDEKHLDNHVDSFLADGDVVFADTAEDSSAGKCVELLSIGQRRVLAGLHTIAVRSKVQHGIGYFGFYFNSPSYRKQLLPKMQGSKVVAVSKDVLKNSILSVPSLKEEIAIGTLLRKLDNLIAAEKRKLNLLKQKKTALLRQIFGQKLRFKGYSNHWECRKLGDMCSFRKGQGYSKKDIHDSGNPLLLYGQMYTNYMTVITSTDVYTKPHSHSVYSTGREVVVPASGETREDIAVASAVLQPGIIYGGDINVLTPADYLDPVFLTLAISGGPAHRQLAERAQGKTIVHLRNSDIAQVDIQLPEESEQLRIAGLFIGIDNLIDTERRKINLLGIKKKALLQKMFV